MSPENEHESKQIAVIDIGSNSVRLVLYRLEGRAVWTCLLYTSPSPRD